MESHHMTQQTFAQFIQMSPATLSSIFNDRTKPTLGIVDAIKKKFPQVSTDWLMFNSGPMYLNEQPSLSREQSPSSNEQPEINTHQGMLDFGDDASAPSVSNVIQKNPQVVEKQLSEPEKIVVKYLDKKPRQITEIRVFYDDQTWETFVPKK